MVVKLGANYTFIVQFLALYNPYKQSLIVTFTNNTFLNSACTFNDDLRPS